MPNRLEERIMHERLRRGVPDENVLDLRRVADERRQREGGRPASRVPELLAAIRTKASRRPYRFVGHVTLGDLFRRFSQSFRSAFSRRHHDADPLAFRSGPRVRSLSAVVTASAVILVLAAAIFVVGQLPTVRDVRGRVLGASTEGYEALERAKTAAVSFDFAAAATAFSDAEIAFRESEAELNRLGSGLVAVASLLPGPGQELGSGRHLLAAGRAIGSAGSRLSTSLDEAIRPRAGESANVFSSFSRLSDELVSLRPTIADASEHLAAVDANDLPPAYRERVAAIQGSLPSIESSVERVIAQTKLLAGLFGQGEQRYLLLFQNNQELRPTGGFIGSLAFASFRDGAVTAIEVPAGGTYDLAGQLREKIVAPKPIQLVNPHWNIQDANWFPDFPASARKTIDFFERTAGFTPDGVIALTPAIVEDILSVTGPIDLTATYGVTVTDENVVRLIREEIDVAEDSTRPKQFVSDLLPILFDRLFHAEPKDLARVAALLAKRLAARDLLVYSVDVTLEQRVIEQGWSGTILPASRDSLFVVDTNVGGGKTDAVIEELVRHTADVQKDGSIVDTVTVIRRHNGSASDPVTGVRNVDYIRFYVPAGSELLSAEGFETIPAFRYQAPSADAVEDPDLLSIEKQPIVHEPSGMRITQEFGQTAFGNWMSVGPGESGQATIRYRLPFKLELGGLFDRSDRYELLVQKQPGKQNTFLFSQLNLPDGLRVSWVPTISGLRQALRSVQFSVPLETDQWYAVVAEKE